MKWHQYAETHEVTKSGAAAGKGIHLLRMRISAHWKKSGCHRFPGRLGG